MTATQPAPTTTAPPAHVALADSPHLPVTVRTDARNALYPWFADHVDASTLTDRITRNTFIEWMSDDAGDIATLLPNASEEFDDGSNRSYQ